MASALSDERKKGLKGFRDHKTGLTYIVIDDVEGFLIDEVLPICESMDALAASQFFIEFCKDCKKHFFNSKIN